jgi:anaerobic selenocysteine-containing dehydrogenase
MVTGKPYPIKGLIIQGSNPILTWPNVNKVRRGIEGLELMVAVGIFMTETAKLADIVLPAAAFLEKAWLVDYVFNSLPMVGFTDRVIDPPGRSLPDWKIWSELGKKMGYQDLFPWENDEEVFRDLLAPTNITLDQLRNNPQGVFYRPLERQRYLKEGFNTPSGKVEIYSGTLEKHGYDPIPTFSEPAETPIKDSRLAKEYPLLLTTGTKINVFYHSEYRNIRSLRSLAPEAFFEINPITAEALKIGENDMAIIESPRGRIKMRAHVTEDIVPGVVSMTHGWAEANANELTNDESRDPITAIPEYRSLLCKIARA